MFHIAIVEDDPMISMLNRGFAERDSRFQVVKEFSNGREALPWLLSHPVDLVILDVYMPLLTGVELLHALRAHGSGLNVIMVTAAHDTQTLDELLKLGVVDYLVKPFTTQRFQQALDAFCLQHATLADQDLVSQSDIDRLLHTSPPGPVIPKGLQASTLAKIRSVLDGAEGGHTCEEVAVQARLSVVTARRYLNFMLEQGQAKSRTNYDTGGRPSMVYRTAGET